MSFKANIEVTSVEEFKKLNEVKIIKEPKIIYKDKIVKVPVEKIVDRIKEVKVKDDSCQMCGNLEFSIDPMKYEYLGTDNVKYKYQNRSCLKCGWSDFISTK